ncbi:MAG: 50S ribosomal protein L3 [Solirubrobacterales bacterium]
MSAIIGKKLGMSQVFREDGTVVPVTVIEAGPCPVIAVRRSDRDGYDAVQLAFGETEESKLSGGELGHLRKAGAPSMRHLVEFRDVELPGLQEGAGAGADESEGAGAEDGGEAGGRQNEGAGADESEGAGGPKVGQTVTVAAVFEEGQKVKVSGVSIGKGFQGGIKRHNFSRGPVSHGSHNIRLPGSIGASAWPARVFKGMKMPGQMGAKRVTQKGLRIESIDAERNLMLIRGSVPGSRNAIVEVRGDE